MSIREAEENIQRLERNDPELKTASVDVFHNGSKVTSALRGNTHVSRLEVQLGCSTNLDTHNNGNDDSNSNSSQQNAECWTAFCQAARTVASLESVQITLANSCTDKDYDRMSLLLQHTREQIKELSLDWCYEDGNCRQGTGSPSTSRVMSQRCRHFKLLFSHLAKVLSAHPKLETFSLRDGDPLPTGKLIDLLPTLSSIPKLSHLELHSSGAWDNWGRQETMVFDSSHLNQLLWLPSLEKLTLWNFEFGDQLADALQEALTSSGRLSLRQLELKACKMTINCLGCVLHGNDNAESCLLQKLLLEDIQISDYNREDVTNLLAPLSHNDSLEDLEISFYDDIDEELDDDDSLFDEAVWPWFDFLHENTALKSLKIIGRELGSTIEQSILESMFRHLATANHSLEYLKVSSEFSNFVTGGLDGDVCDALVEMIRNNVSLKHVDLAGHSFTGEELLKLVPALAENKTLEYLDVTPNDESGSWNEVADHLVEFVKRTLLVSRLKKLRAGLWNLLDNFDNYWVPRDKEEEFDESNEAGSDDMVHIMPSGLGLELDVVPNGWRALVPYMAQNYCIEGLDSKENDHTKTALEAIGKLNKFGRRYLVERGPECRVAGVALLSAVSDDLDCLFYHLRENPSLCNRAEQKPGTANHGLSAKVREDGLPPAKKRRA